MKMKLALLLAAVAPAAFAQSYGEDRENVTPRGLSILSSAVINSATIPQAADVLPFENVSLHCVGSAATVSVSVQQVLRDGTLVRATTQNCSNTNTQLISTTAANVDYEGLVISPTAGLTGTNTLNIRILRLPTVPKQF